MRTLVGVLGVAIAVIGAALAVAGVGELVSGTGTSTRSGLAAAIVLFIGLTIGGALLARANLRQNRDGAPSSDFEREQCILQLAEAQHGRVTIPEMATHCRLSMATSKTVLDRMASEGAAEMAVTDDGIVVYVIAGFPTAEERASAENL